MDVPSPAPAPLRISPGVLWTLRALAAAGLLIALFLAGIHVVATVKAQRVHGPYCQILSFFDCDTVLNSEWATWFGVPVAALGAAAYASLLILLFPRPGPKIWWMISTVSLTIAGAAGWFIYVQAVVLRGSYCTWCMSEHLLGLTCFALIWLFAFASRALDGRRAAYSLGLASLLVGALIMGQHLDTHTRVRSVGKVAFDLSQHLLLGSPSARHIAVEAIDYTCPRCRKLASILPAAQKMLGPDYAIVVLTTPLHPDCNKYYAQDSGGQVEERHKFACRLAELAHAVWLANPSRFEEFHDWLFENQDGLRKDPAAALDRASNLVGDAQLKGSLERARGQGLIAQDVELSTKFGAGQLPGLFAAGQAFTAVPEDAEALAELLHNAFLPESEGSTARQRR